MESWLTTNALPRSRRGQLKFPTFLPVTTFGKYPLDRLIRPCLPRLCQGILVSHHYAAHLDDRQACGVPYLLILAVFALLFEGSKVTKQNDVFSIKTHGGDQITPDQVLEQQMRHAEIGATLDFQFHQNASLRLRGTIASKQR